MVINNHSSQLSKSTKVRFYWYHFHNICDLPSRRCPDRQNIPCAHTAAAPPSTTTNYNLCLTGYFPITPVLVNTHCNHKIRLLLLLCY